MEKNFETGNYNDTMENVNIGQEILIVDENGQFLNVNKSNGYVAEVENSKDLESLSCPAYDDSQQPVYFQLHNSSELIPISVNPIQTEEIPNVFANNYMLQSPTQGLIAPENYITKNAASIDFKQECQSMDVENNKITNEITITDEQYEILKQKGWILLEIKNEVFILDSSGLNKITHDNEFTSKIKLEMAIMESNIEPSRSSLEGDVNPKTENVNTITMPNPETSSHKEAMEIINESKQLRDEHSKYEINPCDSTVTEFPPVSMKNSSEIFLKCPYILKDIPKEILLGKTVNGKKLIARVVKGKVYTKNTIKCNKDEITNYGKDVIITDAQFAKLIQQVLLGSAISCRLDDLTTAKTVITKMSRDSTLKHNLHKQKLIITRILQEEDKYGFIKDQSEPTILIGRFIVKGTEGSFVHMPDMLQQHLNNSDTERNLRTHDEQGTADEIISENDMYLHISITETKDINNITRVSVLVNKRYLSLSKSYNMKAKQISSISCNNCETTFESQGDLDNHTKYWCSEIPPENLHLDNTQPHSLLKKRISKTTIFTCNKCKANFDNINECQEHLKNHYTRLTNELSPVSQIVSN